MCIFFFIKGVQILSPSYYFRWLEALRGQQWNGKEHGSLLLELMLTESERSCHVFWQLTQWVWILQHKVGPFSLSTCLLGNVPSSCFHIDLITLPHWWAWHKTYFLYCSVHHIPSPFPALQHCYFGLRMEDLVSAFAPASHAPVTTPVCRNPLTAHFGRMRGYSGIASCLVPRLCSRKSGKERKHRLWALNSGRKVHSIWGDIPSPCSCRRCWPRAGQTLAGQSSQPRAGMGSTLSNVERDGGSISLPPGKSAPSCK